MTLRVASTGGAVAKRYAAYVAGWDAALEDGVRRVAMAVDNAASERLSGAGAPRTYPIPVRRGFLRRSGGYRAQGREAFVFNSAIYARAHHQGFRPYGNPRAKPVPARPFLRDAFDSVDPGAIIIASLRKLLP